MPRFARPIAASLPVSVLVALTICGAGLATASPHDYLAEPAVVPATPELQAIVEKLKADLMKRASATARTPASASDIRTVSAAVVVWRDTSMGCGKPNESYAQIDVEGYEIVLEHAGQRFDYRVRRDGTFVLCEQGVRSHE